MTDDATYERLAELDDRLQVMRRVADRLADTIERELLAPMSLEDRRATIAKAVADYRKAVSRG